MITVGIDLATQPSNTAACVVDWSGNPRVTDLRSTLVDEDAVTLAIAADRCAIDAPFGWPIEFVRLVVAHEARVALPDGQVRFRATDSFVKETSGVTPPSVAADKLGATAVRCARLLHQIGLRDEPVDRAGTGRVLEAYPAAALRMWRLPSQGYKGTKGETVRGHLLEKVIHSVGLQCQPEHLAAFRKSDDAFDALICALVARMAAIGNSRLPESDAASIEGWIHLPRPGLDLAASVQTHPRVADR